MLLDKLEFGIVALETERGPVYVQPTGWQRLYLLWTFRHFNSLPLKTLNSRQRKLVEKLPRCGARQHIGLDRMRVIGTVEGARDVSFDECLTAEPALDAEYFNQLAVSVTQSSSPVNTPHSSPKEISSSSSTSSSKASAIASVLIFAAFLTMGWRHIHTATILSGLSENTAAVVPVPTNSANVQGGTSAPSTEAFQQPSVDAARPSESVVVPAIVPAPMPLRKNELALDSNPVIHSKVEDSKIDLPTQAAYRSNRVKNTLGLANIKESKNDGTLPRLQFSGPPSHLIYPNYPETDIRGKVTMRAVIGADGRVRGITILSGNKILSAAAKRAVRQWRYEPIYKDGQAIEAETNIAMLFVADAISISYPSALSPVQQ